MEETLNPAHRFPTSKKEFIFHGLILFLSWLLCNSAVFAGLNLGFALFSGLSIIVTTGYLYHCGHRLTFYSGALLTLSLVICTSFARGDDSFVKFIMFCFLIVSTNLAFCLLAGQNYHSAKGITSLLDVPRTVFMLGFGKLPDALQGLVQGFRNCGNVGKKGGAILLGLVIAVPLLAIVIPLLIRADAAFDALLQQLPDWDLAELFFTVLIGSGFAVLLYTRTVALHHAPKSVPAAKPVRGIPAPTVNTVLVVMSILYAVYLLSQLAYFSGGFSGILPKGYSLAQYARRGFFELAWLCAINLFVMALAVGLVKKENNAPLLTRLICLFIGIVTLFLAVSASAKMFLYIASFGLTRLRVLTQVMIFFLGLATAIVCVWLFVPKMAYMKIILIAALVIGAVVAWADVDTVVARYNINAYQSGKLESVDVHYLNELGASAVPYIALLQEEDNPLIADTAREILSHTYHEAAEDFRSWNYVNHVAKAYFPQPGDLAQPKQGG